MASNMMYDLSLRISSNAARLKKGINDATKKTSKFEKKVKSSNDRISKSFKNLGGAIAGAFAVKGMANMVQNTAQMNKELLRNSKNLAINVERLQELRYAASQAGVQQESFRDGLKELTLRADEFSKTASGPAAEAFQRLGISNEQLQKVKGNTDALFSLVTSKFSQIQDSAAKQRIADELFGGQAAEQMITMLSSGIDKINQKATEAREKGIVVDAEQIRKSAQFQEKLDTLRQTWQSLSTLLVNEAAPALTKIGTFLSKVMTYVKNNSEQIKRWAKTIATAVAAFAAFKILQKGIMWVRGFSLAFRGLNTAMKANIIFAIVSAVIALTQAVIRAWKQSAKFRANIKYLWEYIKYYFGLAKDFVVYVAKSMWKAFKTYFDAITDLGKTVWKSIKAIFQKGKSPGEIFKNGLQNIKNDVLDTASDLGNNFKDTFSDRSKPSFDEILDAEKAKKAGKEAGKDAAKGVADAMRRNNVDMGSALKMRDPGVDSEGIDTSGTQLEKPISDLDKLKRKSKEAKEVVRKDVKRMAEAFKPLQYAMERAFSVLFHTGDIENALKTLWQTMTRWITRMIGKLIGMIVVATIASAALAGLGLGTGGFTSTFKTITGTTGKSGVGGILGGMAGNVLGLASGGVVSGETIVKTGEYSGVKSNPEVIAPLDKLQKMGVGGNANIPSHIKLSADYDELSAVINTGEAKNKAF